MKKLIAFLILSAMLISVLVSCSSDNITVKTPENTVEVTETPVVTPENTGEVTETPAVTPEDTGPVNRPDHESDKYFVPEIYMLGGWFVFDLEEYKYHCDFGLNRGLGDLVFEDSGAEQEKYFDGYNTPFQLYTSLYFNSGMGHDFDTPLDEIQDMYQLKIGEDFYNYTVIRGTDKIVAFTKPHECSGGNADVNKIAENFIEKEWSKEVASKFRFVERDDYDGFINYDGLIYRRYIEGYASLNDFISISVCSCGEVESYSAYLTNIYNNARETISKRRVEYSYELLKQKVDAMNINVISYGEPKIIVSYTGEYFIAVDVTHLDTFTTGWEENGEEMTIRVFFKY